MGLLSRSSMRLRPVLKTSRSGLRAQTRCRGFAHRGQASPITPVTSENETDYGAITIARFRELAYIPEEPLLMKAGPMFLQSEMAMPAIKKWFDLAPIDQPGFSKAHQRKTRGGKVMSAYLKSFASKTIVPFELAYPQSHRLHGDTIHRFIENLRDEDGLESNMDRELAEILQARLPPSSEMMNPGRALGRPKTYAIQRILHFSAPLTLLNAAVSFNLKTPDAGMRKLYVAQAPLNDLPKELQDDLPVPRIVEKVGKGDIYDSSIWLGLEPTYTPLHRDPNPNLFIQLCGEKVVRLLPPASGDSIYHNVQRRLGHHFYSNPRLRGPEMMDGPERELMHEAVWLDHRPQGSQVTQEPVAEGQNRSRSKMQEARLKPGDALFIPKGWWHSVKSNDDFGRLNASVNWWFR